MFCLASIQDYIDHSAKIGHKVIFASMSQLKENLPNITLGSTYTYLGINESGTEILVRPYQSKTTSVIKSQYFNQPIAVLDRVEAKHLPKSGTTVLFRNIPIIMMIDPQDNPDETQYVSHPNPISLYKLVKIMKKATAKLIKDLEQGNE